ncbi:MAG TPA: bifunctional (p)ppGpp synthetase/guanosine-3',5'-bis(diphosphate) 3'-pyrophosphohydrolase [Candidatus Nanoarchaeia archaeon]|nr:bifunctional (p)ppGpp synthetase/guanosine-3',5'-bis(diphosphate) 3'-pyrophosphohydrolase [Candidatus Nanoarchaeia archaeon]
MAVLFSDFIREVLEYNPYADKEMIRRVYEFAKKAHEGQKRQSGEPYITHPVETARILAGLRADSATICAALLHDCVEDECVSLSEVKKEFGEEIASLVEGVTKITGVKFETKEEYKAQNLRKVLFATAKDIRVMLIKLADRLHNMQTLKHFREDKQKRIAQDTLDIYAPIAHKLGMWAMKGQLEDLALKSLDPDAYHQLRGKISSKRHEREEKAKEFLKLIKDKLKERGIDATVEGRAKYFYSIYLKMKEEKKDFNEIYDLIAVRIITNTIPECYAALGVIHELYKPMPGRFKDYISVPKANGYQSLHTSVVGGYGRIIEVQIRTWDMHHMAEEGIAAHWRYKGEEKDKKFDRRISWLKQLLDWKRDSKTAEEFVETLKIDLFENEIVVFTPKGDPISLPEGSTPVDFAYAVHTNIGNQCAQADVNRSIVPLDYKLKNGDIVNIITKKNAVPSRNWLNFVKSSKARSKIKGILNISTDVKEREEIAEQDPSKRIEILSKKAPVKFSKCCAPRYGDPIIAFYTKDGKITVHKKDCRTLGGLPDKKPAALKWKEEVKGTVKVRIVVNDRVGMLAEILNLIAFEKINIQSIYTRSKKDKVVITLKMALPEKTEIGDILSKIKGLKDIIDVKRAD